MTILGFLLLGLGVAFCIYEIVGIVRDVKNRKKNKNITKEDNE